MLTEKLLTLRTHDLLGPQSNFYSAGAAPASSTEGRGLTLKMFKTHLTQFNSRLTPSVLDVFRRGPPDLVHHYFTVKIPSFIFRNVLQKKKPPLISFFPIRFPKFLLPHLNIFQVDFIDQILAVVCVQHGDS